MRLLTYLQPASMQHAHVPRAGLLLGNRVLHLVEAAQQCGEQGDFSSVVGIIQTAVTSAPAIRRIIARAAELDACFVPLNAVTLLAPIPRPIRNVFCVGRNYVDHVKEGYQARQSEVKLPEAPQFFTKATHTVVGPSADVRLDAKVTSKLDYEVELAVIIGEGGRDITPAQAMNHVFGYSVANDVTARDLQRRHDQWFKGKSLDTTLPFGPIVVSKDEVPDVAALELALTVNGEPRQRARVAQMIFDIPTIIASLSAGLTLEAGDIIATGTPSGVGFAMDPPHYLQPGDVMVASIAGLGELRNRIVAVE